MKLNFEPAHVGGPYVRTERPAHVQGETDRLTDVILCAPSFLTAVPCCSVTCESLRQGFTTSRTEALRQHRALRNALSAHGVTCHDLAPDPDSPDLCFTRDIAVTTPWGPVVLNPAKPHRSREADLLAGAAEGWTGQVPERVIGGSIEGGDICIARPGLLIIGVSGERTTTAGAEAFASRFRADGWDILIYHFDPHFLHLDTLFCMVGPRRALACAEVLDDWFLDVVASQGIEILPVSYKEARRLGCNVLSIDDRTVLAGSATPRVTSMLCGAGLEVIDLDIGQFSACGGGIHCLTMPLNRRAGPPEMISMNAAEA